jgi:flagellar biosynthesis anti-sigma factor FlgM
VNVSPSNPQRSNPGQSPEANPPARTDRAPAAAGGTTASSAGSVELSAQARAFLRLRPQLEAMPQSGQADRVARLRAAIQSGTYTVSGEAIADAMLRDGAAAAALGLAPHA